jgi:hypothetical protein
MIDTVTLRIHDTRLHDRACKILEGKRQKGFTKSRLAEPEKEEFTHSQRRIYNTFLLFHDTGKIKEIMKSGELNSSYHYVVKYYVDYEKDFIQFEFSLPKYLYGTNIVLFTRHCTSKNYNLESASDLDASFSRLYDDFMKFAKFFFDAVFPGVTIYQKFTELARIDLCWNQVFPEKWMALDYLKEIKRIRKKYSRDGSNVTSYRTSLNFVSEDHSFKIYHKGTEYRRHDKRKHSDINKEHPGTFDIQYLEGFADKILRYEMTFRGSYMSYLIDQHGLRANCDTWAECKTLTSRQKYYESKGQTHQFSTVEKQKINLYKHLTGNTKKVMFSVPDKEKERLNYTDLSELEGIAKDVDRILAYPLNAKTMKILSDKFLEHCYTFKASAKIDRQDILTRFKEINEKREKQLENGVKPAQATQAVRLGKIEMILNLLEINNMTFDDLRTNGFLPKSTYYYTLNQFKRIGFDIRSILPNGIPSQFNLKAYHLEVFSNPSKFFRVGFLEK